MGKVWFVTLVIVLIAALAATPAGAIKYVKWNAPGPVHDGTSWKNAYLTIQAALDAATTGELVFVAGTAAPGAVYAEKIVIKSGVVLRGGYRGDHTTNLYDTKRDTALYVTVIDGGTPAASTTTVTGYSGATIDGFTIQGAEAGIRTSGMATINDNIITGSSKWGIICTNNATITYNSISSNYYGIDVTNCAPTITTNTFDGKGTGKIGLYCFANGYCYSCGSHCYTCAPSISDNTISGWTDNAVSCSVAGVSCATCGGCTPTCIPAITNNTISGGSTTIYIASCRPSIVGNTITGGNAGNEAIAIYNCSPSIGKNIISGNCKTGILCAATSSCYTCGSSCGTVTADLFENIINGVTEAGIHCYATRIACYNCGSCEATCNPTIRSNTIRDCGQNGIVCRNARPSITLNTITGNTDCGVYAYNDISSTSMLALSIDGNKIADQKKGVRCNGVSITVKNNTIQNNLQEGVLCQAGSASVVTDNTISGSSTGVVCSAGSPIVARNIITSTRTGGVRCDTSGSPIIDDNLITGGMLYGVNCQGSTSAIRNNTIVRNNAGIQIESGSISAHNNIIANNLTGVLLYTGTATLSYNNLWQNDTNYDGVSKPATDTTLDPMFLAPSVGEYHLLPGSPCVEAGSNTYVTSGDKDADGKTRILPTGGTVDMGCFEWEDPTAVPYLIRSANQAKVVPSQYGVQIKNKVVSAAWDNCFYLEDDDLKSGIRVEKAAHGLTGNNQRATVTGNVQVNSNGECCILADTVTAGGVGSVVPLGLNGRNIGGGCFLAAGIGQQGMTGCSGLNNIGLLVRVWGRVTEVEPVTAPVLPTWFKIVDGSGRQIKCVAEGGSPVVDSLWQGKYATVTGISSCEFDGPSLVSVIRMKSGVSPVIY